MRELTNLLSQRGVNTQFQVEGTDENGLPITRPVNQNAFQVIPMQGNDRELWSIKPAPNAYSKVFWEVLDTIQPLTVALGQARQLGEDGKPLTTETGGNLWGDRFLAFVFPKGKAKEFVEELRNRIPELEEDGDVYSGEELQKELPKEILNQLQERLQIIRPSGRIKQPDPEQVVLVHADSNFRGLYVMVTREEFAERRKARNELFNRNRRQEKEVQVETEDLPF